MSVETVIDNLRSVENSLNLVELTLSFVTETEKRRNEVPKPKPIPIPREFFIFKESQLNIQLNDTIQTLRCTNNGSLCMTGISNQGIDWCKNNFVADEKDIFIYTFPKVKFLYSIRTHVAQKHKYV